MRAQQHKPSSWESARAAKLHKIALTLVLAAGLVLLTAIEIQALREGERPAAWARFTAVMVLSAACSTICFSYSTLRGPYFERDRAKREARQKRNQVIGLLVFGLAWAATLLWIRDLLARLPLIPLHGIFSGFLAGIFFGVAGVWYFHHRHGTWPPDQEARTTTKVDIAAGSTHE